MSNFRMAKEDSTGCKVETGTKTHTRARKARSSKGKNVNYRMGEEEELREQSTKYSAKLREFNFN